MPERIGPLRGALGGLAVVATLWGLASLTRWPIGRPAEGSELRLALRSAAANLEICRERSAEELARLPAHLRERQSCDEIAVDFHLVVRVDGLTRLEREVSHSGVRHTRPLAVDEVLAVAPGRRRVEVAFLPRIDAAAAEALVARSTASAGAPAESDDDDLGEREPTPASVRERLDAEIAKLPAARLSAEIEFVAGRARLVTLSGSGALELVTD